MTLTVRSASLTGATTAARALTHAEMDANWAHVIESSNQNFTPSGSGAVARSSQDKVREIEISTEDFDNGESDYADVVTKAFDHAETLLASVATQPDGAAGYASGSIKVKLPKGTYSLASAIDIPPMINFEGDGCGSTVLNFTFDGACVTVKSSSGSSPYPYNSRRGRIANLRIAGDLTATSQDLLSLTRFTNQVMENVEVEKAGRDGIVLTECVGSKFSNVRSSGCGRKGWKLTSSAGPLPSNANVFVNCAGLNNVAEGLDLDEGFGNNFFGGVFQDNFDGSMFSSIADGESATMRQVLISKSSRGNLFLGTWFEGEANAHVYVALTGTNATQVAATFAFCHFIPKGTAGNVDRAVVCNKGSVVVLYPGWQATSFRTINSSNAPFRVGPTNTGRIYIEGVVQTGTSADIAQMVEDNNGNDGNLGGLATVRDFSGALSRVFGRTQLFGEHSQVVLDIYRTSSSGGTDWDESPFFQVDSANRGLKLGSGLAAPDTLIKWIAANVLGTEDTFVIHSNTAVPAGGTTGAGMRLSSVDNFGVFFGSGAPTLSAAKGSLYLRSDGTTTNDRAYINTDGGTTWTALTTAG
jgi:hypothetical protein